MPCSPLPPQEEAQAAKDAQAKDQGAVTVTRQAAKVPEFDEKAEAEYYKLEHAFKIRLGEVQPLSLWLHGCSRCPFHRMLQPFVFYPGLMLQSSVPPSDCMLQSGLALACARCLT